MKTERLVILVTLKEKRAIAARAKALKLSTSEVVRRAVENFNPGDKDREEVLNKLADELEVSTKEARRALQSAMKEVNETLSYFASKKQKKTGTT